MHAADVCVLPYRRVSTSGAALLAFSFGVPVIAPALGSFVETVGGGRGMLYEPTREGALAEALTRARSVDWSEAGKTVLTYARALNWDRIARQHLGMYRGCVGE